MNKTTCALAVMHQGNILVALPTNGRRYQGWSLPKGIMDEGETYAQAALRECVEETSLDFRHREAELIDLGVHKYRPGKDYHLSVLHIDEPVDCTKLVCESMFIHNEQEFPECSDFAWVTLDEAIKIYLNPHQAALVSTLIKDK